MERVTQHLKRFAAASERRWKKTGQKLKQSWKKLPLRHMHMSEWVHKDYIKSCLCFTDTLAVSWHTDQKPLWWRWRRTLSWLIVIIFIFENVIFLLQKCISQNVVRELQQNTVSKLFGIVMLKHSPIWMDTQRLCYHRHIWPRCGCSPKHYMDCIGQKLKSMSAFLYVLLPTS